MEVRFPIMKIQLNGTPYETDRVMSVSELLESLGFGGKPVVVELNEQAIFPRDYPIMRVETGASIEIVTLAAGG
jgi:sulfur carrier protein